MIKLTNKSQIRHFELVCWLMYMASYIARYGYGAMISEISASLNASKALCGLVSTALFISYGMGQLISGRLGDKYKPYRLIFIGIFSVSVINVCMALVSDVYIMIVLWFINGFFHSLLWPPLVRFMSDMLTEKDYADSVVVVSVGSACGTIIVYLLIPLCLRFASWRAGFNVCGLIGFLASVVWFIYMEYTVKKSGYEFVPTVSSKTISSHNTAANNISLGYLLMISGVFPMFAAITMQGILRDGVLTWMPDFVSERFNLSGSTSILTAVLLPIFSVISFHLSTYIQSKIKDELKTAIYFFSVGAVAAIILIPVSNISSVASVLCMALIVGSMHGVNMMLISRVPPHFAKYGKVSTVSGIVNSFTYIGAAASTYGIALISENFGWTVTLIVWAAIAAAGTLFCCIAHGKWKKFILSE